MLDIRRHLDDLGQQHPAFVAGRRGVGCRNQFIALLGNVFAVVLLRKAVDAKHLAVPDNADEPDLVDLAGGFDDQVLTAIGPSVLVGLERINLLDRASGFGFGTPPACRLLACQFLLRPLPR